MKKFLFYGVSTVVLVAAIWYLLNGIKPNEWMLIAQDFGNLNWGFVSLGMGISMVSHLVRAERWRTILRPLHANVKFTSSMNAVMIGYAFNTILPRAGEVVRPVMFARREGIRTEEALGSILVERILDVVSLLIAFLAVVFFADTAVAKIFSYYSGSAASSAPLRAEALVQNLAILLASLGSIVAVLVFTRFGQLVSERIIGSLHGPTGAFLSRIITRISSGLSIVKEPRLYLRLTIESLLIWGVYCLVSWCIIIAMPYPVVQHVTIAQASIILVVMGIAVTIAPTPGALGVYQIAAQASFVTVCGATPTQGLVFGMISWFVNYGLVLLGGGICWLLESRNQAPSKSTLPTT